MLARVLLLWALSAPARAGDLALLDAMAEFRGQAWESPPVPGMTHQGGNGADREQYVLGGEPLAVGKYRAKAVTYEYIGNRLGTAILAFDAKYDGEGVLADLVATYGPPTWEDPVTKVWRGEKVRLVWKQHATDLWVVTWSWLALHTAGHVPPKIQAGQAMDVPHDVIDAGVVGRVTVELSIDRDGNVTAVEVVTGLHPAADAACVAHSTRTKWTPYEQDGVPTAVTGVPFSCRFERVDE